MDLPLVLVVEDEFLVRMNAVSLLEEAGFAVLEAGSADEAIVLLEGRRDIRIVFTDINMWVFVRPASALRSADGSVPSSDAHVDRRAKGEPDRSF